MKFLRTVFLLAIPLYLISCGASRKAQPPFYLERSVDSAGRGTVQVPELRIQKNDLLSIQVYSASTRPEVDQLYNLPPTSGGASAGGIANRNTVRRNFIKAICLMGSKLQ